MTRPALLSSLSRWLSLDTASPSPAERAQRWARNALEAHQATGALLGQELDKALRCHATRARAVVRGEARPDPRPVGLVVRTVAGHGLHLQERPSSLPRRRPPEVTVGLIDGTLAPCDLHDLLRLIRQIEGHGRAVEVHPTFGSWLPELLAVAGRLLDQAQTGDLLEDYEKAIIAACVDLAPHASFTDMDLGALCAFHFYCRVAFPASETAHAQRAAAARDTPAHDPARAFPGVRRTLRAAPHVAAPRPGAPGPA